jgi:hypothetical protein
MPVRFHRPSVIAHNIELTKQQQPPLLQVHLNPEIKLMQLKTAVHTRRSLMANIAMAIRATAKMMRMLHPMNDRIAIEAVAAIVIIVLVVILAGTMILTIGMIVAIAVIAVIDLAAEAAVVTIIVVAVEADAIATMKWMKMRMRRMLLTSPKLLMLLIANTTDDAVEAGHAVAIATTSLMSNPR